MGDDDEDGDELDWETVSVQSTRKINDTGLAHDRLYSYRVQAWNDIWHSEWSKPVQLQLHREDEAGFCATYIDNSATQWTVRLIALVLAAPVVFQVFCGPGCCSAMPVSRGPRDPREPPALSPSPSVVKEAQSYCGKCGRGFTLRRKYHCSRSHCFNVFHDDCGVVLKSKAYCLVDFCGDKAVDHRLID